MPEIANTTASGVGVDWCLTPQQARELAGPNLTIQGNFDPNKLLLPPAEIKKQVKAMIDGFGAQRYIANLGHGILPNIPVDNAKAFVQAVKEYGQ